MSDYVYIMLVGGLTLLVVVCFGAMVFFFVREFRLGSSSQAHNQHDLTNMMILFQTMRDLLSQQKDLAREFNISIDKKVNEVRKLIQSTGDVRSDLDRAKREIAALAARTRKEMDALDRRLAEVDRRAGGADVGEEATDEDPFAAGIAAEESAAGSSEESFEEDIAPPLEVLPEAETSNDDEPDFIDRWTSVDLGEGNGENADELDSFEEPAEYASDDDDGDIHETREAFRDLLNLQPAADDRPRAPSSADILEGGRDTNGGQYLTPIQKRVYEYSDAGMRVPEIARELGVGKGEVRLILSLRQDREH